MANLTHSAFRRLLAELGGCGAVFTEMLSARMILHENGAVSPWLKRRPGDGPLFYQLLVNDTRRLDESTARIAEAGADGLDLNAACGAPTITPRGGGAALFENTVALRETVRIMRHGFPGPLTVKIRLGRDRPDWRARLLERLRLLEDEGIDAVILHPRFLEDGFRRRARHELIPELAAATRLPLIANGDIAGPDCVSEQADRFRPAAGLMIGRQAAARPWLFAQWRDPAYRPDPAGTALRFCAFLADDFPPGKALRRLKVWIPYFAANFTFGHTLFKAVQQATEWEQALDRLRAFLAADPELRKTVSVQGI